MGFEAKRRRKLAKENVQRILKQGAKENALMMHTEATDEYKDRIAQLLDNPRYRTEIEAFARACLQWRRYNPDAILEWHDTTGVLLSGDPGLEHVRRYLAKNDTAANMIQYADEATGRVCSLLQVQFALVGLCWIQ